MMKSSRLLTIMLSIVFAVIATSTAKADIGQMIQDGIDYLEANQDESGLWGTDKETPYRDSKVIVDVLARLAANHTVDPEILDAGYQAVYYVSTSSTDYLARKIIASASVNDGVVYPNLIDSLVNMQNSDGGWGYQKYYGSNTLETSLAIKALVAASYEDPEPSVLTPAGTFLVETQNNDPINGDYGWAFVGEGDSRVLFTAHAVTALSALQDNYTGYDFSTQIENAFVWLKNAQHGDNGFGSNESYSNAYETGLAICAMVAQDPAAPAVRDAWDYLENTQLLNGSWDSDAYSTAMAISGLNCIDPDNFVYEYLPGDVDMYEGQWPPIVNYDDAAYLKDYLQGYPSSHPCLKVGPSYNLWASADVNGDCIVDVADYTYLFDYLQGRIPSLSFCPDFEPVWPTPPPSWPVDPPPGWPDCYEGRLVNDTMQSGGVYIAGDCNHNGTALELGDVVSMISMYRGIADAEYTFPCPPHGDDFAPEADPNGNCVALELAMW
jgi:hypothetical protein